MKKMTKTLKQSLSILLAAVMVITSAPQTATSVLAAEVDAVEAEAIEADVLDTAEQVEDVEGISEEGGSEIEEAEAVEADESGTPIYTKSGTTKSWDFRTAVGDGTSISEVEGANVKLVKGTAKHHASNFLNMKDNDTETIVAFPLEDDTEFIDLTLAYGSTTADREVKVGDYNATANDGVGGSVKTLVHRTDITKPSGSNDYVYDSTTDISIGSTGYGLAYMTLIDGKKYFEISTEAGIEQKIATVTIVERAGSSSTTPTASFTENGAPKLTNNSGSDTIVNPGDELTLSYEIEGIDEGNQDESTINWFTVADGGAGDSTAISADKIQDKQYTVDADDVGKVIRVEITPKTTSTTAGDKVTVNSPVVTEVSVGFASFSVESSGIEAQPMVGDTLTVSWTLAEGEERVPTVKWERTEGSDNGDITGASTDTGAKTSSYKLTEAEKDHKIKITVTLAEDSGKSLEEEVKSYETEATVSAFELGFKEGPSFLINGEDATNVSVLYPGDKLEVSYDLNNPETGDDATTFKWKRIAPPEDSNGKQDAEIENQESKEYTVTTDDIGYQVQVTVTPKWDDSDTNPEGDPVDLKTTLTVSEKIVEIVGEPSFEISAGGNLSYPKPENTLTVKYVLNIDDDEKEEDNSDIQWIKVTPAEGGDGQATETPISSNLSEDNKTYTIQTEDVGSQIKVKVTPKAKSDYTTDGEEKSVTSNEVKAADFVPSEFYNMNFKASDIPSKTYTSDFTKYGFTIHAGNDDAEPAKSVTVDGNNKGSYTARLKMGNVGTPEYRSVSFTVEADATLKVVAMSGNSNNPANLGIATLGSGSFVPFSGQYKLDTDSETAYNASGITLDGADLHTVTATLSAGTYYLYTTDFVTEGKEQSSINFYEIDVNYGETGLTYQDSDYYTVSFDTQGALLGVDSQKVLKGEKCLEPSAPLKERFTFAGWVTEAGGSTPYNFDAEVTQSCTVYASWTPDSTEYESLVLDMKDLPVGDYKDNFSFHDFNFFATSGKSMSIADSNVTVGEGEDTANYTKALKFGGAPENSTKARSISFEITQDSTLTVVVVSGSSSDGTRKLYINKDTVTKDSGTFAIENINATQAEKRTQDLSAGTWYLYASNNISLYYISVKPKSGGETDDTKVAKPTVNPNGGSVSASDTITLNSTTNGATFRYTLNGGDPSLEATTDVRTVNPFTLKEFEAGSTVELKAVAVKDGMDTSELLTATFTVKASTPGPGGNEDGLKIEFANADDYQYDDEGIAQIEYTGSAIKPDIIVTNTIDGETTTLVQGVDYTVKYSNNTKVSTSVAANKKPKITVSGKGILAGKTEKTFEITPKDIAGEGVVPGRIVVVAGKKISTPSVYYGSTKLAAGKDFTYDKNATFSETGETTLPIEGAGNFTGTSAIDVVVVENAAAQKAAAKKFTVKVNSASAKGLIYTGESLEEQITGCIEVTAKTAPDEGEFTSDYYTIVFPQDLTNAGTVKFTVVGLGEYSGCNATKSVKILPKTITAADVVTEAGGDVTDKVVISGEEEEVTFTSAGATQKLSLKYNDNDMTEGKDYKVTYSNNKKAVGGKAKYTITFTGNYKGKYASQKTFNIAQAELSKDTAEVYLVDKTATKNNAVVKSTPYVVIDNAVVKSSEYEVKYFIDENHETEMAKDNMPYDESGKAIIYVTVSAKTKNGINYVTPEGKDAAEGQYTVWLSPEKTNDLSKAKVTFYDADGTKISKVDYSGMAVEPAEIKVQIGKDTLLSSKDDDCKFDYTIVNNVNKGKATVIITPAEGSGYAGGKTATFSVVSRSLNLFNW